MLNLRGFNKQDIEPLVLYLNNANVTRFLTSRIPQPYTVADAQWWVNAGSKEGIAKAIEVNGRFVGTIGVTAGEYDNFRSAEIGYWLAEQYWGKGVATGAVMQMTKYVFLNTEIIRLYAPIFHPNKASIRVLEKCGYQLEGVFNKALYKNEVFFDEHIYAKVCA